MPNQRSVVPVVAGTLITVALAAADAAAQKRPPVALATAERSPIVREVSLTGSLSSPQRARLAPEVAGRVTAIGAEAGDTVAAGDDLLRLDGELSEYELRQAVANRRETSASLAEARRRVREAQELVRRDSIGESELEARRAEVERLQAVLARREAEQAYQAGLLQRHSLNAPFAGVINARMIDLGERATPSEPVFELVATDRLHLDLEVPQQYFGAVTPGTPVLIRFDALPDTRIDDRVDRVVPVSNPNSRTFLARIDLDNADGQLMPGMSARATLRIDVGREGIVIPQDALIRHPDGRTVVWVATGDGDTRKVHERRVEIGVKFGTRIAVREGLEAGTMIVTEGNEALQDGQDVRVTRVE